MILYTRTDAGADPRDFQFYLIGNQAAHLYGMYTLFDYHTYRPANHDEIEEFHRKHKIVWGLVGRHTKLFYHIARKYEPKDTDNFVLGVCIPAALRACRDFDISIKQATFITYLYRAIQTEWYNTCRSNSRRRLKEKKSVEYKYGFKKFGEAVVEYSETTTNENMEFIESVLARVDNYHRYVLTLRFLKELTYDELSFFLRCGKGGVKNKIQQAINACRQVINNDIGTQNYAGK